MTPAVPAVPSPLHRCVKGHEASVVFFLPGAWEGGICQPCAMADPEIMPTFRAHFGEIRHVSDGDRGKGLPRT